MHTINQKNWFPNRIIFNYCMTLELLRFSLEWASNARLEVVVCHIVTRVLMGLCKTCVVFNKYNFSAYCSPRDFALFARIHLLI